MENCANIQQNNRFLSLNDEERNNLLDSAIPKTQRMQQRIGLLF